MNKMQISVIFSFVVSSLVASCLSAQEVEASELCVWLPGENLKYVEFYDPQNFFEYCPERIQELYYEAFHKRSREQFPEELPELLRQKWRCFVKGSLVKVKVIKRTEQDIRQRKSGSWGSIGFGGNNFAIDEQYTNLRIYYFDSLKPLMKSTFRSGQIARLARESCDYPLYSYRHRVNNVNYFLTPVTENILLICSAEEKLESMIRAGHGEGGSALDSFIMTTLGEYKELLGPKWKIETNRSFWLQVRNYFHKNYVENPAFLESINSEIESERFSLNSKIWQKDGTQKETNVVFLQSDDAAAEEAAFQKGLVEQRRSASSRNAEVVKLVDIVAANTSYKVEGNTVIETIRYPLEYFHKRLEFIEKMNAQMKEKEAERKQKREEEG